MEEGKKKQKVILVGAGSKINALAVAKEVIGKTMEIEVVDKPLNETTFPVIEPYERTIRIEPKEFPKNASKYHK